MQMSDTTNALTDDSGSDIGSITDYDEAYEETLEPSHGRRQRYPSAMDIPLETLKTNPETGLDDEEVQRRQKEYGKNVMPEEQISNLGRFLRHFTGPVIVLIEIAAVVTAAMQRWISFGVICSLLFINAVVGFLHEYQSLKIISKLRRKISLKTRVVRNSSITKIDASDLVPGDIVVLEGGDVAGADVRVVETTSESGIAVDHSTLTGENGVVFRCQGDIIYSTAVVRMGTALCSVLATGKMTYIGRTTALAFKASPRPTSSPTFIRISGFMISFALFLIFLIIVSTLYRNLSLIDTIIRILIVLTLAIPIALPAVVTTSLAIGASLLAHRGVIVKRLSSVGLLASTDILCVDKTGTLTKNKVILNDIYVLSGHTVSECLLAAALASLFEHAQGIDLAIKKSLRKHVEAARERQKFQIIQFCPFDSTTKRTLAVAVKDSKQFTFCKGAANVILEISIREGHLDDRTINLYKEKVQDLAQRGFRCLGVTMQVENQPWELLGLLSFSDPLRKDSFRTIQEARALGMTVKMVTGDGLPVAKEVAKKLGIGEQILDSKQILILPEEGNEVRPMYEKVIKLVESASGFAQVLPEHKFKIVNVLQRRGHIVAMTGDGVNDAPALNESDCGIAVKGSTESAKEAAALILVGTIARFE